MGETSSVLGFDTWAQTYRIQFCRAWTDHRANGCPAKLNSVRLSPYVAATTAWGPQILTLSLGFEQGDDCHTTIVPGRWQGYNQPGHGFTVHRLMPPREICVEFES